MKRAARSAISASDLANPMAIPPVVPDRKRSYPTLFLLPILSINVIFDMLGLNVTDASAFPPFLSRKEPDPRSGRAHERWGSRAGVHPAALAGQSRQRLLSALRLHHRLYGPSPE